MVRPLVRSLVAFVACLVAFAASAEIAVRTQASARQPDGKIVFAGKDSSCGLTIGRLNDDGTRDNMFGSGGSTSVCVGSYNFEVRSLAVLPDGKLMVGAMSDNNPALIRFTPDGQVDAGYGYGPVPGMIVDTQTPNLVVNALVARTDGSVLAFGSVKGPYPNPAAAVVRYNPDGSRDMAFAGSGVWTGYLSPSVLNAAAVTPEGDIVAAGGMGNQVAVARFTADGTNMPSFGQLGWAAISVGFDFYQEGTAIAVEASGNIVVAGTAANCPDPGCFGRLLGVRLTAGGVPMDSFTREIPLPGVPAGYSRATPRAVAPLADGDVAIAATVMDNYNYGSRAVLAKWSGTSTLVLPKLGNYMSESAAAIFPVANGELVYLGAQGDQLPQLRRERRFADNFDFDIDYSEEWVLYDQDPNPFTIAPVAGAAPGTFVTSAPFRISGINQPIPLMAYGGTVSVGCVEPYAQMAEVSNGQWVCARVMTAPQAGVTTSATVVASPSKQATFSVSTVGPPETTITSAPTNTGYWAVIYYQGDTTSGPITGYECRVDADPFAPCPDNNHVQVGPLAVGPHTFEVRAMNAYGTDATPAIVSFTVMPEPETTITSGPPLLTNASTATFTFASDQPGSTFYCSFNGGQFQFELCQSPVTYSLVQSGTNVFRVYAMNVNEDFTPASYSFTVDRTPPDTLMTRGTLSLTYLAAATFNVSSPTDANATYECSLDAGAWYACGAGPTVSVTVTAGNHALAVRAVDAVGNVDPTPDSKSWTFNDTPLDTTLTAGPAGTIASRDATFTYSSNQIYATFACSLTGPGSNGAIDTCPAAGKSYSFLGDGTWTFRVWAVSEGVSDPTPAERTWIVDTVAPSIAASAPGGTVNARNATIEFFANESGVSFRCSMNAAPGTPCTSPLSLTNLADGTYTLEIAGIDLAGNRGSTVRQWVVDATGPDTTITSGPSGAVAVPDAQFAFTSSEGGATFQCRLDGAAYIACTSPVSYAGLADGAHAFEVRATDAAGNVDPSAASASWTIDTSAPDTVIDAGPSGTTGQSTAAFAFHASEAGTTFECSIDSAAFAPCSSGVSFGGLGNGMHMFEVRARDGLGNADATPASRTWSVDLTQPNTTITSGPPAISASASATFAFTATEPGTFMCSLDGAAFSACASPVGYALLASGSHAFAVYALDAVGNADASPATWSWIVDTVPPQTTITSRPPAATNQSTASFAFSADEAGSTFECKLDAGAWSACTSPAAYSGLAAGSHTFQVRGTDGLGNVDQSPATFTWVVDVLPPDTTITSGPSGNQNPPNVSFSFASTEAGGSFECRMDGVAFAACTSPIAYTLAKGAHTFEVRAIDAAGNADATPAARSFRTQ